MKFGAEISECGRYRYCLWRDWVGGKAVTFVMLNPSTADAKQDDPTIRKCIGFARRWGFGSLAVVNVFAFRATNPRELPKDLEEAIGPDNNHWIEYGATYGELIVPAWGVQRPGLKNAYHATDAILQRVGSRFNIPIECLGLTKGADPRHPLYVSYDIERTRYPTFAL